MLGLCRWHVTAAAVALIGIAGLSCVLAGAAQPPGDSSAVVAFTPDGKLKEPEGYRKWVYVGTPITPNELNGGEAPFPDFHAVYIDPDYAHYEKTGEFPRNDRSRRAYPSRADDPPAQADNFSPYVTKDGGISRPTDYRETFEHLGTYRPWPRNRTSRSTRCTSSMRRPEDVRAYRRDRKFPTAPILVNEVTRVGPGPIDVESTGPPTVKAWFVTITPNRREDSPTMTCGATGGAGPFLAKRTRDERGRPRSHPLGRATSRRSSSGSSRNLHRLMSLSPAALTGLIGPPGALSKSLDLRTPGRHLAGGHPRRTPAITASRPTPTAARFAHESPEEISLNRQGRSSDPGRVAAAGFAESRDRTRGRAARFGPRVGASGRVHRRADHRDLALWRSSF